MDCSEEDTDIVNKVSKVFIRKYTHARIGGFISGQAQKRAEKTGKRFKGGSNLRDNLYNITGTGKKGNSGNVTSKVSRAAGRRGGNRRGIQTEGARCTRGTGGGSPSSRQPSTVHGKGRGSRGGRARGGIKGKSTRGRGRGLRKA